MTPRRHIHFVTGKLAADALQRTVASMADRLDFEFSIGVLPISVAALMTPDWIAKHIQPHSNTTEILLPGYCEGDLQRLAKTVGVPVSSGPRDLHELPTSYGLTRTNRENYGARSIEIIAEINHVPKLAISEVLSIAQSLSEDGADVIDLGCIPGDACATIADYVRALRDAGLRVSIDSFDVAEISAAVRAGAELVLSVNSTNRDVAADWGCEVVAIPDEIATLGGLEDTIDVLESAGVRYRLDPILEPIGCGFAQSLQRYLSIRKRFPDAAMMMGIGNLTELTDCDSAGINVLLLGFCEELGIGSVLTTQVIPWAQTSVRECDLARKLVHHAVTYDTVPKHIEPGLIALRDASLIEVDPQQLQHLADSLKDRNFRLFADAEQLHVVSSNLKLSDRDPFKLFERLMEARAETIDVSHAFYLGFELAKASTARTLGKSYRQDDSLDWGYLTQTEDFHRIRRTWRRGRPDDQE